MNNNYNENNNQNNNYNQNMNFDPYTGQPLNNNYPQGQYQNVPMNNIDGKADKIKLIIATIALIVGIFFAGIICGVSAIALASQVKKSSTSKTIIIVFGAVEVAIVILSLIMTVLDT